MDMREFAALAVGDKIENNMNGASGAGEVVETVPSGVRVVWGERHSHETKFFYSVNSTAWMHWSRPEPEAPHSGVDGHALSPLEGPK